MSIPSKVLQEMTIFDALLLAYWPRRITDHKFFNNRLRRWIDELTEFSYYAIRMLVLETCWKMNWQLSQADVLYLSYPLSRMCEVFIRKRQMFPLNMELKAFVGVSLNLFLLEMHFRILVHLFDIVYSDLYDSMCLLQGPEFVSVSRWLVIFLFCCAAPMFKLFPILPLHQFNV
ncbi:hypothetical protein DdX_19588 [Ditylenchus destructor]|uniref:Uncharacterized protein n=1 Tax=Ditylenchus destructor TaxID=166010 RepID=A0AAD4QX50_9BILA|nr:hypothetical protein DdX_19588 [Ditylenchus destructor]